MPTESTIPVDERFFRWLADQIQRTQHGSIHLEIEQGKLRWIGCHNNRFIYSPDALEEQPNA